MNNKKDLENFLLGAFAPYVGKRSTNALLESIEHVTNKALSELPIVQDDFKTEARILWNTMSFFEKIKWFMYNRFPFKSIGNSLRNQIDNKYEFDVLTWQIENSKIGSPTDDYPYPLEYPSYLQPSPKTIVLVTANIKLHNSIIFLPIKIDIK